MSLKPFPIDDVTLVALEHALDYTLTLDDEGNPISSGAAEYSIHTLLDFLAGCLDDDGLVEGSDGVYTDDRPHYTERDVILALIGEVRRLRGVFDNDEDEDLPTS